MENETSKLITRRADGAWEVHNLDGDVVVALAKKPSTADWFRWAQLMEARKQTALLVKLEMYLGGIGLVVENLPDFEKLAEKMVTANGQ
jgi:hypothetical protein